MVGPGKRSEVEQEQSIAVVADISFSDLHGDLLCFGIHLCRRGRLFLHAVGGQRLHGVINIGRLKCMGEEACLVGHL